jgi:hypothetical protein
MTLPVLLTVDRAGVLPGLLLDLRRAPDADTVAACATVITNGGGVAAAAAVARWWLTRALDSLRPLPRSDAVKELTTLAQASVERGLRLSTPSFGAASSTPAAARSENASLIEMISKIPAQPTTVLDPSSVRVLEWFHPGLATMVAVRAAHPRIQAARVHFHRTLQREPTCSSEAAVAADTIALAHALANDDALGRDPVRTLALVDALHCAAIGFLATTPSAEEHQRLAARARHLHRQQPSPNVTSARTLPSPHHQPAAVAPA